MTLEPDRRSLPGIGHHGYPLARPPAQKLARTGGALHLQASSQFTDSAAAAGLRALEKRVESVPVAVYEFLQAGGVAAAVTIITSEPVAPELRDAAISLLSAVARKQPQAMSLAFTEAKGMAAVVHLLGRGIQPRGGALTAEGAATVAAAARLLEAALDAGGQAASGAFGAAGGFAALRTALACGQLSGRHATEVAERAVGLLHRLVWAGNKSFTGPQHAALCASVCAARTHQPLLALIYTNSHVDAAVKGMEVLRALAAASTSCMQALLQSNCIDTCLTVLDRADFLDSNSNMRTAVLAALLLHDALDWDLARRSDILAKGGVSTFLNVLLRTPSEDAPIADVVNSLLRSLAEGSDDVTHQDGKRSLHWAAQFGELEALEKILIGRPNLQAKDERGNTALHLAAAAGHMPAVKLLIGAGADATARNFAGVLPHQLAVEGSPLWASLLAELDWRACLEQPRPCQYAATEGDASCSEEWHGPAKCFFLPLSGRVRIESAGVPLSPSKHWFISAIKGHRSKAAQPDQQPTQQPGHLLHEFKLPSHCDIAALDDLTLSLDFRHESTSATTCSHWEVTPEEDSAGFVGVDKGIERGVEPKGSGRIRRLVIRVDSPPDQRAPDLARAVRSLLHRCYPASEKAATGLEAMSSAAGTAEGHLSHEDDSGVDGASAMSPRSTLSHFLRSADALQAKRAGSQQFQTQQSQPYEESCTAPSPSLPQLDADELEAPAGRGKEAASSCRETLQHAQNSVGENEGQVHLPMPREGGSSGGVAARPSSHAAEPNHRQVSAQSAPGQRRPSSALEIARRLRRAPASKSGADSAVAKAGDTSEAKLGSPVGRSKLPEAPSGSASVCAQAASSSGGPGVTAEAKVEGSAASSTGRSGPPARQGAGVVQPEEEDLAPKHVSQAVDNAHTSLHNKRMDRAAEPLAAAAEALPAIAEEQQKALLSSEPKEHRPEQDLPFKHGDGPQAATEGTAAADAPKTLSDRAAVKALHTMSYLPLAENQQSRRKAKAPPPPPPPPPLLRNYGPAATVDPTATAAAVRAADEVRRQQLALGRGKLYAPSAQSVADKVRELELQIGLVQQLNSQGLRKEEAPVAHATNTLQATSSPSAPPPEDAETSGKESAAGVAEPRGELVAVGEGAPEPAGQRAGQAAAEEGTLCGQVTGQRAESASREGMPGVGGSSDGVAAAVPTRPAAERFPADAAAVAAAITGTHVKNASTSTNASVSTTAMESSVCVTAGASTLSNAFGSVAEDRSVCGTRLRASTSTSASINMTQESPISGMHLSASTSGDTSGESAADNPVSAVASGAGEQAPRRRKPFYYGPRNTAPDQLHKSAVASVDSARFEAMPRREDAESSAELLLQIPKQAKAKRKPFAYGPRPSTLNAESAAIDVERLDSPAQSSSQPEGKDAAAGRSGDVASAAMQHSTPAGVIFLNGGTDARLIGEDSASAAIQRDSVINSFATEKPSASRNSNTAAVKLHSSTADAASLHRGRSVSMRKPFAYGPRKPAASENMAPSRSFPESQDGGGGESGGALGVRQGWSADPRFIRG